MRTLMQTGLTLLELLAVLTILGIALTSGLPSLRWLQLERRMSADVNAFVSAVQTARSESAKRRQVVVMCNSTDARRCGNPDGDFATGWIVSRPADDQAPLLAARPALRGSIRSNRVRFEFRPFLRRSTNGTVVFCDERGAVAARAVIVSYTGRPRTVSARNGARLACPT